jgi:peptidoglycan/LPS O-acetylase OafA/YrhL
MNKNNTLEFRNDIQGLRALAVLAVMIEHAAFGFLTGGYIGVDIFFVISGYLITSISLNEVRKNEFSVINFYLKRLFRILPALLTFLVFWTILGYFIFPPSQYEQFGNTAVTTLLFYSNIDLMWQTGDYFGFEAAKHPLLHTWSLSVEEQFYLLFPFILALTIKRKNIFPIVIITITILSLISATVALKNDQNSVFYLIQYRAWELGIGSILALFIHKRILDIAATPLSIIALTAIGFVAIFYTKQTPFPGPYALPVVLGTAVLIYYGKKSAITHRILSTRPLVYIGKISYSLYLWHWPPLVFIKTYFGTELTILHTLLAIAFSIIMSTLSYRFIESRIRQTKNKFTFNLVVGTTILCLTILTMLSAEIIKTSGGISARIDAKYYDAYQEAQQQAVLSQECTNHVRDTNTPCLIHIGTSGKTAIVWGDSHAAALLPGAETWAKKNDITTYAMVRSACASILGLARESATESKTCLDTNQKAIEFIIAHNIETIILSNRWALSYHGTRFLNESGTSWTPTTVSPLTEAKGAQAFEIALIHTIQKLKKISSNVILIGNVPELGERAPNTFLEAIFFQKKNIHGPELDVVIERTTGSEKLLRSLADDNGIDYISMINILCTKKCSILENGRLLYRDDDHLSTYANKVLYDKVFGNIFFP